MANTWFNESSDQSEVKREIVSKYFDAWTDIIIPNTKKLKGKNAKIAYIDLFAGPGRYIDGTKSTPVIILEKAVNNINMRQMLLTIFNDVDTDNTNSLQQSIDAIEGINRLKYSPIVMNHEVGTEIVKMFESVILVPTLFFVDPWGYKGLSLRLINSVLKDWGCECIFFFNYNRISMGLSNEKVKEHMDALFGEQRAEGVREKLTGLKPNERELAIVESIAEALKEMGGKYVLPFRFKNNRGTRTSHHLIFVSKNFTGYKIMKDIMAKASSTKEQGVASFEYSPADEMYPMLFEYARPLDDLKDMLLSDYSGKTISMKDIFEKHSVGRPFIRKNYADVLQSLADDGIIKVEPKKWRNGTFPDRLIITFP